ncbi:hypothetical protein LTS18_001605 [Coniosporium uncinatum]|uniref:Uncharacterized protein n=1 Tax=Coniosporium uncinatum TaxID=93489 RepID=A0ACC3DV72_9PEZI|nr:hypothetical protein LTS18_001605 [Coniosporium uncinatum]
MPGTQAPILAFGRISKAQPAPTKTKKRKAAVDDTLTHIHADTRLEIKSKKQRRDSPHTPAETPTRAFTRKLADLAIHTPTPFKLSTKRPISITPTPVPFKDTPPSSPCSSQDVAMAEDDARLPDALQDLIQLNAAFLTALSLHYAHNGTGVPVDLRQLGPSVTKLWGKRKVMIEDIRRCLGVMQSFAGKSRTTSSTFILWDYGRGKVCIELASTKSNKKQPGATVDEEYWNTRFISQLEVAWKNGSSNGIATFIAQLPLANITVSTSVAKAAPLMAKGQRRLEEMMSNRPQPQKEKTVDAQLYRPLSGKDTTVPESKAPALQTRGQSLLDRIRDRQLQKLSQPAAPTKEQMERLAALHRCEEIIRILDLLVAGKGMGNRASFSLAQLVQDLRSSVRSPMPVEEVRLCIKLLESEVAPGYVKCVSMGAVTGAVVDRAHKPLERDVRARLAERGVQV